MANLKPYTTVLNIYARSGAITIFASKFVKKVIGIESNWRSVQDARYNAAFNNIHNIKFLLGKPKWILKSLLKSLNDSTDIVAIVNPGYNTLKSYEVNTIRRSKISRLLYISNKPQSQYYVQNFVELCSTNTSKFKPFKLTKVIPVDLFPQTAEVELILIFERSLHSKNL